MPEISSYAAGLSAKMGGVRGKGRLSSGLSCYVESYVDFEIKKKLYL